MTNKISMFQFTLAGTIRKRDCDWWNLRTNGEPRCTNWFQENKNSGSLPHFYSL